MDFELSNLYLKKANIKKISTEKRDGYASFFTTSIVKYLITPAQKRVQIRILT